MVAGLEIFKAELCNSSPIDRNADDDVAGEKEAKDTKKGAEERKRRAQAPKERSGGSPRLQCDQKYECFTVLAILGAVRGGGAFSELFRNILEGILVTIERRKQKRPRSRPLEPARVGSTSAKFKIEEKVTQKSG